MIARKGALIVSIAGAILFASGFTAVAQTKNDFTTDMTYYVTAGKNCQKAGTSSCGNLTIFRDRLRSGSKVHIAMYHQVCLGNVAEFRYRWVKSRVVHSDGGRFYVKVDRPGIKLKLRGRFIDGGGAGFSEVKGTLSFRNLNRKCGFRPFGFREQQAGPTTDPQG